MDMFHFISLDSNIIAGYRAIAEQAAFIREGYG